MRPAVAWRGGMARWHGMEYHKAEQSWYDENDSTHPPHARLQRLTPRNSVRRPLGCRPLGCRPLGCRPAVR
jgi:hypothetical protein